MKIRLAHLSDIHFSIISKDFAQFFSKRWLGNLHLFLSRKQSQTLEGLEVLPELFKTLKIDYLLFTGDLSSTSSSLEFSLANKWLKKIQKEKISLVLLPGNHDKYTKKADRENLFFRYFSSLQEREGCLENFSLEEHGVEAFPLKQKNTASSWWYVGIDPTLSTSLLSSRGFFSKTLEKNLLSLLSSLPPSLDLLLACHFPFSQKQPLRKLLKRGSDLEILLKKFPSCRLFLHGHTHAFDLQDLRKDSLPITIDAGSVTKKNCKSWNLLDLGEKTCTLTPYHWEKKTHSWNFRLPWNFSWE